MSNKGDISLDEFKRLNSKEIFSLEPNKPADLSHNVAVDKIRGKQTDKEKT
jgi:hypothetical protein